MAILQTRMIALINAALDYKHGLERLINAVHKERMNIIMQRSTPEAAFQNIELLVGSGTLLDKEAESSFVIATEHYHFSKNKERNAREADKLHERRQKAGLHPQKTHWQPPFATTDLILPPGAIRQTSQNKRGDIKPRNPMQSEIDFELNRQALEDEEREAAETDNAMDAALRDTSPPEPGTNPPETKGPETKGE